MDNLLEISSMDGLGIKGKILWSGGLETIKYARKDDYDVCRKCNTLMNYHRWTYKFYCPSCKRLITEKQAIDEYLESIQKEHK